MIKARNNFVFILRDEAESEVGGLYIPSQGQEKPNHGKIIDVGHKVIDKDLLKDKGKRCLFHKGNGFTIDYDGVEYLVVEGERIIGVYESGK